MGAYPKFTMSFSIGPSNKERIEAFELYQRAFKAKKLLNEIGKEAQSYHTEGPYPWAAILGLVVDKFGIGWALYYNE